MKEIATIPLFATPLTVYEIEHINQEKVEEINIDEEVGFITIKEMRKIIKQLIKNGIDEKY